MLPTGAPATPPDVIKRRISDASNGYGNWTADTERDGDTATEPGATSLRSLTDVRFTIRPSSRSADFTLGPAVTITTATSPHVGNLLLRIAITSLTKTPQPVTRDACPHPPLRASGVRDPDAPGVHPQGRFDPDPARRESEIGIGRTCQPRLFTLIPPKVVGCEPSSAFGLHPAPLTIVTR